MSRKGSHEGIDEITASIDAVLAEYDQGGLGWSKDGDWEPYDPILDEIDWEALRLAEFDRNPPEHGPWLNVIPPRLGAAEHSPEYAGWFGQWAAEQAATTERNEFVERLTGHLRGAQIWMSTAHDPNDGEATFRRFVHRTWSAVAGGDTEPPPTFHEWGFLDGIHQTYTFHEPDLPSPQPSVDQESV